MLALMSSDQKHIPDALACLAASAALAVSDIPFNGPISEVRVARVDGQFMINPNMEELARADIDLMVAGSMDSIVMVEGEMKEVSEAEMVQGIEAAHSAIKVQCQVQLDLVEAVGGAPNREYNHEDHDDALRDLERQLLREHAVTCEQSREVVGQIFLEQVSRRQVHRDLGLESLALPLPHLSHGAFENALCQSADQPGVLREPDELVGWNRTVLGVIPAHQRLGRDQIVGGLAHRRYHDDHVVAPLLRERDIVRDRFDAIGITNGGSAVFLDDQCHG